MPTPYPLPRAGGGISLCASAPLRETLFKRTTPRSYLDTLDTNGAGAGTLFHKRSCRAKSRHERSLGAPNCINSGQIH